MYQDCQNAMTSIEFEQYIFKNDVVGQRFMKLFIEKAAQGVKVLIIADMYGSSGFYGSDLVKNLRNSGGHFYFYNVISLWDIVRPWRWFPRTHIKTLLVDSSIAYTGGVCFDDQMKNWRDTHIRIMGPVVAQVRKAFDRTENIIGRKRLAQSLRTEDRCGEFVYLQSYPLFSWHIIYNEVIKAIGQARHQIYISTPFFAPNRRFRRLLRDAARRGVNVQLLVPAHSDVAVADWVGLSYARKLLEAGARIFHYQNSVLHCKTVVIDDQWATVGSTNMDVLSFFRNRESNLVIRNNSAIEELKQHFLTDLQHSQELTLERLGEKPRWKLYIGYCARLFKSFLWRK